MPEKKESKAIISSILEKRIGEELHTLSSVFFLIYKIIIETGVPFNYLTSLSVSDFINSNSITYRLKNSQTTTVYYSKELLGLISTFIEERSPQEPMFLNANKKTPLNAINMQRALSRVSLTLGICDTITLNSLHKTYHYHVFLKNRDLGEMKVRLRLNSKKDVLRYFGLSTEASQVTYCASREELLKQLSSVNLSYQKVEELIQKTLSEPSQKTQELPAFFSIKTSHLLESLGNQLEDYLTYINSCNQ